MEFFLAYLLTRLFYLQVLVGFFLGYALSLIAIGTFVGVLCTANGWEDGPKYAKQVYKYGKWPLIALLVLDILLPTREDVYLIAGGGLTLMAVQSEEVQKIPENAAKAVNLFLESFEPRTE